ncbi:MAG: RnfABCDGE type electron transport complex subunit D, partial [Treponema sp.]|nr:RnfABCDGE type electron transport complex subunit D [Treponema sp.]
MIVSYAPHINYKATTSRIMLDVIIALCPAFIVSVWIFGSRAALVTGLCIASCVFFEWTFQKLLKKKSTVTDLSAALTGMLLAFNLPVTIPLWQAVFGCLVAIVLVKQLFGGIGKNFANPAITARVVMFLAFSTTMTTWAVPFKMAPLFIPSDFNLDTITGATPLMLLGRGEALPGLWDMFLGRHGGCIGETSELALLLGGLYLVIRGVIKWYVPFSYIAVVFILTAALGADPLFHILSGGLFLGAIFMATDYVTTPLTNSGRVIFGIGAGLLTVLIRLYG